MGFVEGSEQFKEVFSRFQRVCIQVCQRCVEGFWRFQVFTEKF